MKQKSKYNVAIMGATGAVGEEMLKILEERNFPVDKLVLLASHRSVGRKYVFKDREIAVQELTEDSFSAPAKKLAGPSSGGKGGSASGGRGIDIVLANAGSSISKKFAFLAVKEGAIVIDNTSAFRMDPKVPLVIPEINAGDIKKHKGIIANPNCSSIILLVPI